MSHQPIEGIHSAGKAWPQIDVKNGNLGQENVLGVVLQFTQGPETHAIHLQRGIQDDWHQFAQVFVVVKKHNSRLHFSLTALKPV